MVYVFGRTGMSSKSRVWLDVLGEERLWGEAPELNLALGSCKVPAFELHWHIMLKKNIYIKNNPQRTWCCH